MTREEVIAALTDVDGARRAADALDEHARALEHVVGWEEAAEIFRRVGAREITAGHFLTSVGEAVGSADLENKVLMLPTLYRLLAKYPRLIEDHRKTPVLTTFPPSE